MKLHLSKKTARKKNYEIGNWPNSWCQRPIKNGMDFDAYYILKVEAAGVE